MMYPFLFLLLLAVFPAWGEDSAQVPNGETGAITSDAAEVLDPSVHVRLGYLLIKKGALDEAMKSFDEAIRLNPRSCDAKTGKGIVLARKGNLKEAEQVLKDALVLNPNPVRTHYELGLIYQRLDQFDKAIAEFKEGIKKHELGRM